MGAFLSEVIKRSFPVLLIFLLNLRSFSQSDTEFRTVSIFKTSEARQGVAVDAKFFYAINSTGIGKYDKATGRQVMSWKDTTGMITHLDGAIAQNNEILCAHSNYPGIPMVSSIEIFRKTDLRHTGSHSFGNSYGSCTWADFYRNSWWVCFAHYDQFRKETGKGSEGTILVRFDRNWKELDTWTFPERIISEVKPMSVSGGSWGPDGRLYVTGHDSSEVYVLKIPEEGHVLEFVQACRIESEGQGIAWDRRENELYGIIRKNNSVVVSALLNPEPGK